MTVANIETIGSSEYLLALALRSTFQALDNLCILCYALSDKGSSYSWIHCSKKVFRLVPTRHSDRI